MNIFEKVIPQLPLIVPTLLVYVAGAILSLVNLKRHAKPAMLALAGCGVLALITAVFPLAQACLIASQPDLLWTTAELQRWLFLLALVRTILHAIAFLLVLAAIFTGRRLTADSANGIGGPPN